MMSRFPSGRVAAAVGLLLAAGSADAADVFLPATVTPVDLTTATYGQSFDTLASTGSTGTALPAGWQIFQSGSRAAASYVVNNGASNSGNVYSYGATGSTDRALGSLASSGLTLAEYGAVFTNTLGAAITDLAIGYTGEQWRAGSTTADALTFQYSLNATDIDSGDWITVDALAFTSPNAASSLALDGNAVGNRTALAGLIDGLSIADGDTFAIRWVDTDSAGSDDGLAIDDLTLTATVAAAPIGSAVPEPATWATFIGGFGLVGGALRRSRARLLAA